MRVLFLSTWFPYPPDNGSRIRAYHLVRALSGSHQVTLVAFRPDGVEAGVSSSALDPSVQVYPVPADPYRYVDIPEVLKFASPLPVAFWPNAAMQQMVAQMVSSGQWDVVVAFQTPAARYALQLAGVPRILDVDTALSYQMYERHLRQNGSWDRLRTWASWQKAHQYEVSLFRRFQACTVVTSVELNYVAAMLGGADCTVKVVPNGVDCQHNCPGLARPVPGTLVFNGALTYSVNYDAMRYFLAEVYPLIRQQSPDVSLTITGSISGVDTAGLQSNGDVHFSGYVQDIRPWVASASVCVAPLRQGSGTRLKILEAMALGTPVVSTSKGAEGLDVIDGDHILLADDPTTFAHHTLRLLRDPDLRRRLTTNARSLVEERYDWLQIGQRFVDLIEDVAGRRVCTGGRP